VGATDLVAATLQGGQTHIWRLVRAPQGWKADLRWAGRARAMAEQGALLEPAGSPEWTARQLPLALASGEAARLSDGRVVQGSDAWGPQLMLGLFGVVALPFLLQRIDGPWRVLPQPWFPLLMR
jgi:hypothetical protein